MTKDLITIIDNNIQYLKNCLDLTEAHITWGTKNVKEKYSKVKERLTNKMREQLIDRKTCLTIIKEEKEYEMLFDTLVVEEPTVYEFPQQSNMFNILSNLSLY